MQWNPTKRLPKNWLSWSLGGAAAILGVASAAGITFSNPMVGVAVFVSIAASAAGYLLLRRQDPLRADITPFASMPRLKIGANSLTTRLASGLASQYFGENSIDPERVWSLYRRNLASLITVYDNDGVIDGYLDYFPITRSTGAELADGKIDERDIETDSVLPFAEWKSLGCNRHLYLAGVVVDEDSAYERGQRLHMLIWGLARALDRHAFENQDDRFIAVATAYSEGGANLLTRLGFSYANARNKLGRVFCREVTYLDVQNLIRQLPDFSGFAEDAVQDDGVRIEVGSGKLQVITPQT